MSSSDSRPELADAEGLVATPTRNRALQLILEAVQREDGLYYGNVDGPHGEHCAIGAFFRRNPELALRQPVINAVAKLNDAAGPTETNIERRDRVIEVLKKWIA